MPRSAVSICLIRETLSSPPRYNQRGGREMDTHVKVAAWLRIAASAVYLVGALIVMTMFGFAGAAAGGSGDAEAVRVAPWIAVFGTSIAIGLIVIALPGLITG